MVSDDSSAGFGVAIFGKKDDLLFQMKGPIHHDSNITPLEAELTALKRGLTEAANLGITHISIYCDDYPIYEFVSFLFYKNEHCFLGFIYVVSIGCFMSLFICFECRSWEDAYQRRIKLPC